MKYPILLFILIASFTISCKEEKTSTTNNNMSMMVEEQKAPGNIYQFEVTDLYGDTFDFSSLKGKKIMVVNTASECGLTPQYGDLQKLYETYKDKNFIIIGFPANNFGAQEPGSDQEIASFCKENYGVLFR